MRKLVTVRKIDAIDSIDGADMIVAAKIGGWPVVTKKDEFVPGDYCVYFEIDSFLPETDHRFQFLMKNKTTWNGHVGARLKTIKLRGQISQGLVLPLKDFPEIEQIFDGEVMEQDFAEMLNVLKWEPVIPAALAGVRRGNFPVQVFKTDQERVQNLRMDKIVGDTYEVTMKLEGSSMTVANIDGEVHVCSRNFDIKLDDDTNAYVRCAKEYGLIDAMAEFENFALQGELMGPGVQGNVEGFTALKYFIFDVFDIKQGRYLLPDERVEFLCNLEAKVPIDTVPYLETVTFTEQEGLMDNILDLADGKSINAKRQEGIVFKSMTRNFTFKAISNEYLLKGAN